MGTRGKQSTAALAVVPFGPKQRPEPPSDLTPEQAKIWRDATATRPPEWFTPEVFPLLRAYCCTAIDARVIEALLAQFDPAWAADKEGLDRYERLVRLRATNNASLAQLATKMRLTQQSRYDHQKAYVAAAHTVAGTKPWQRAKTAG